MPPMFSPNLMPAPPTKPKGTLGQPEALVPEWMKSSFSLPSIDYTGPETEGMPAPAPPQDPEVAHTPPNFPGSGLKGAEFTQAVSHGSPVANATVHGGHPAPVNEVHLDESSHSPGGYARAVTHGDPDVYHKEAKSVVSGGASDWTDRLKNIHFDPNASPEADHAWRQSLDVRYGSDQSRAEEDLRDAQVQSQLEMARLSPEKRAELARTSNPQWSIYADTRATLNDIVAQASESHARADREIQDPAQRAAKHNQIEDLKVQLLKVFQPHLANTTSPVEPLMNAPPAQ